MQVLHLCPVSSVWIYTIPRSLFTDSLNHFKLMFTNPHDEEFNEENLDEKTARDNLVMEVRLTFILCVTLITSFFLQIVLDELLFKMNIWKRPK